MCHSQCRSHNLSSISTFWNPQLSQPLNYRVTEDHSQPTLQALAQEYEEEQGTRMAPTFEKSSIVHMLDA